jgi:hypothetical protein
LSHTAIHAHNTVEVAVAVTALPLASRVTRVNGVMFVAGSFSKMPVLKVSLGDTNENCMLNFNDIKNEYICPHTYPLQMIVYYASIKAAILSSSIKAFSLFFLLLSFCRLVSRSYLFKQN